jgi:aromatic ring-opening dioxygenase catalytic subunit (LigB family)
MSTTTPRMPVHFLSHGGGPWPWMAEDETGGAYAQLRVALKALVAELPASPRAVLLVTAHWEAVDFTLSSATAPGMIYDYGGFPPHTYQIQYPAPGAPDLAEQVQVLLRAGGVQARLDATRGYDHGTFVVMAEMFPNADVPLLQVSLKSGLDPAAHLEFGRLLAPLREQGVLIIGSGLSYHNLRLFNARAAEPSRAFDDWLQETVVRSSPAEREQRLLAWAQAPSARIAHPREEHLLPLMVAVGAADGEPGQCPYHEADFFGAISVSNFSFGAGAGTS